MTGREAALAFRPQASWSSKPATGIQVEGVEGVE
jgi:hypothetical protein